jgi:hypothetical protein
MFKLFWALIFSLISCVSQKTIAPPLDMEIGVPKTVVTEQATPEPNTSPITRCTAIEYEGYLYNVSNRKIFSAATYDSKPVANFDPGKIAQITCRTEETHIFGDVNYFWFELTQGKHTGWVAGRNYGSIPANFNFKHFKAGCLGRFGCDGCSKINFRPDGSFETALGCHDGGGAGTWKIQGNQIVAVVTFRPSCYDSCGLDEDISTPGKRIMVPKLDLRMTELMEQYATKYQTKETLIFFQTKAGLIDHKVIKVEPAIPQYIYRLHDLPAPMHRYELPTQP